MDTSAGAEWWWAAPLIGTAAEAIFAQSSSQTEAKWWWAPIAYDIASDLFTALAQSGDSLSHGEQLDVMRGSLAQSQNKWGWFKKLARDIAADVISDAFAQGNSENEWGWLSRYFAQAKSDSDSEWGWLSRFFAQAKSNSDSDWGFFSRFFAEEGNRSHQR